MELRNSNRKSNRPAVVYSKNVMESEKSVASSCRNKFKRTRECKGVCSEKRFNGADNDLKQLRGDPTRSVQHLRLVTR